MAAINFPTSPADGDVFGVYKYVASINAWLVNESALTTLGVVTTGTWNANPIAIAYGGTGATTVAGARTALGLAGLSADQLFTGQQTFISGTTATKAIIVQARASQTGNLQEWQNSSGTALTYIEPNGRIYSSTAANVGGFTPGIAYLGVQTTAAVPAIVARAASSQTANLQEWRDSADNILARVDASGDIYAPTFTGTLIGSTTSVIATVPGTTSAELVRGNMADNDQFRILVGGTGSNTGYAEIATGDDGTEPIYVRQYTGSNFGTLTRSASLLDSSGNTSFPGVVTSNGFTANAGTASVAPITLTAGTNLTNQTNGVIEYDGTVFWGTPSASYGRSAIATNSFTSGIGTAGIAATTNYALFPAANDTLTLNPGVYRVELAFQLLVATSVTATALNFDIRGAGTAVGTFTWIGNGTNTTASAPTQYSNHAAALGTSFTVAPSSAVAGRVYTVTGFGLLRITTAGTIIPSYQFPVSPASGVVTLYADNHMLVTPLATGGAVAGSGGWK